MDINTLSKIFSYIPGNVYLYTGAPVTGDINAEITSLFVAAAKNPRAVTNVVDCGARGVFIHYNSADAVTSNNFVLFGEVVEKPVEQPAEETPPVTEGGE